MITSVRLSVVLLEQLAEAGIAETRNGALKVAIGRYLADRDAKEVIGSKDEPPGPRVQVPLALTDEQVRVLKRRASRAGCAMAGEVTRAITHALWLRERFGPQLAPLSSNFSSREIDEALFILHERYTERYEPKGWLTLPPSKVQAVEGDDEWRNRNARWAAAHGVSAEEVALGHPRTRPDWVEPPPRPTRDDAIIALRNGEVTVDLPELVYLDADQRRVYPYKVTNG